MELCFLLAVAHPPAFTKFLIILILLLIAVPTLAAVFTAYSHRQRRQHQEELDKERDRAEIARLTAEVSAARAAAHRIGYALHDRVGNRVSALSTDLHLLQEHPEEFSPALAETLCESIVEIKEALRDAASTFSGHTLHESGLVPAMQTELKRLEKSSKLRASLCTEGYQDGLLNAKVTDHLYHVFLEGVWNAHKHADATQLTITLRDTGDCIHLCVADDGKGFEIKNKPRNGMGLYNIRSRATLAQGTASIKSTPGAGTSIHITLPKYA
ncbi:sensor histidine kinase [Parapedobacter sp. 2B3]|uniref:sensor histidine kinase n=1 Tax=Parapedobacter sp. 2B3 TaxID=3342381 RepID=UPI0035B6437A